MENYLSISITLYSGWHEGNTVSFYLRNLVEANQAGQIEHIKQIMSETTAELHHIAGYGIDKGIIKINRKKVEQIVYYGLEPQFGSASEVFKHKVKISFEADVKSYPFENKQVFFKKPNASFALPCVINNSVKQSSNKPRPLFSMGYKNQLVYDRNNPTFQQFIARFHNDGNLCIGNKRYFVTRDFDGKHIFTKLMPNACFGKGQQRYGKNANNIRVIQLASKPVEKSKPMFKTSKRASLPLDGTDYVYIIRAGRRKVYKIGISNDPQSRLNSLQTASPEKLKLLYAFKADNASTAEESLHFALRDSQMEGEWFRLSDEQVEILLEIQEFKEKTFVLGTQLLEVDDIAMRLQSN